MVHEPMSSIREIEFYPTREEKERLSKWSDFYYFDNIDYERIVKSWEGTWIITPTFDHLYDIYYSESMFNKVNQSKLFYFLNREHKKQFLIEFE